MITTQDLSLNFGNKKLFEEVNIKFTPGNCYGVIGANGAGKSTFLKILSGEIEPTTGQVSIGSRMRMSVLKQDHFQYDDEQVLQTVMLGNERLMTVIKEKDAIYAKGEFSEEDGIRAAELESEFAEMGGWEAESEAATLLSGLGVSEELHQKNMSELKDKDKVKVLLAQALFGQPDILLLDEPTNHLDVIAIKWLENFLLDFDKTVIVVSHDRHFLNQVCTHMVDIDFRKVSLYVGNYDFWKKSSELALTLRSNENKKREDKAKELEAFIRRFSANASKSKQATARKKQLEKLTLDDIPASTRKYPYIKYDQEREAGDILLEVKGLTKEINGEKILDDVSFEVQKGDKILLVSNSELAISTLFEILMGHVEPDDGSYRWGVTTSQSYIPKDFNDFFEGCDLNLIDWLRQFSEDQSENFIRGFLGRMLFSGEDTKKQAKVLSGGEKVRCMLSRMMLQNANVLLLDQPTNHLDLESITSLNNGLIEFKGTVLFATHDLEFAETVSTRIVEVGNKGVTFHDVSFGQYVETRGAELAQMQS
ncbi:ABC-F family ATP-binding cassette domain-containing protein [Pseudobacteriovorax antillogorgiicola]|uniref:Probable ATP-binding protein YbiT n=1 Tax=Pseudobacteriovorax antillogorgiicola TaxID=1513793 RepID=A0A1Y6CF18_9BACT|nr:ATP-binding cassette domain-containing protein [Pseudobacteriovorax antillogorgiicola]TCS47645.1 ATPase subunit of ABC transporter with duplicated ATPase domains [Pseudobacteriovorax antillogorgiicola]SMF59868.1 ATPase components of ABC transporters with duplicated ATPase domains [Pseudobacteriovorax antillogorgiicola]